MIIRAGYVLLMSLLVSTGLPSVVLKGQDNNVAKDKIEKRISGLEKRLDRIDDRLARIENVLFASIRFSEAEARRQLDEAKERLAQSERLHAQGLLSAAQLELDRMSLDRASTLLKMCIRQEDHRKIGATLALMDAKQLLERKQLDLLYAEKLFQKGFIAKTQIAQDRAAVLMAGQKLKLAEVKLKELESSFRSRGQQRPANKKSGK